MRLPLVANLALAVTQVYELRYGYPPPGYKYEAFLLWIPFTYTPPNSESTAPKLQSRLNFLIPPLVSHSSSFLFLRT